MRQQGKQRGGGLGLGGQQRVLVQPCYAQKATILVIVHGFSAASVTAPVNQDIEQVVNRESDDDGQDARGARVTLAVHATPALVNANVTLTHPDHKKISGRYATQRDGFAFRVNPGKWHVRAAAGTLSAEGDVTVYADGTQTLELWLPLLAKATFTRASERTLPDQTALGWTAAGNDGLVFTRQLVPDAMGDTEVVVDLGLGGGDRCTVGVGMDQHANAVTRNFTSWREIDYELFAPLAAGAERVSDTGAPFFEGVDEPSFSAGIRDRLATVLDPLFVRFRRCKGLYYTREDLVAANARQAVQPSEYFLHTQEDRKVTVLVESQASNLRTRMSVKAAAGDRDRSTRMSILFCDYLTDASRDVTLRAGEVSGPKDIGWQLGIFPKRLSNEYDTVTSVEWKVTQGLDEDVSGSAASEHVVIEPGRARIRFPILEDEEESIVVAEPAAGKIVLVDDQLKYCQRPESPLVPIQISLEITVDKRQFGRNGFAFRGEGCFALGDPDKGPAAWQSVARTVLHELAHNMGQTYGPTGGDPFNRKDEIPGVPFPPSVPAGDMYIGRRHEGPHCAAHLNGDQRVNEDYRAYTLLPGRCILWGSGIPTDNGIYDFCPRCQKHILAEDLTSITKLWGPSNTW